MSCPTVARRQRGAYSYMLLLPNRGIYPQQENSTPRTAGRKCLMGSTPLSWSWHHSNEPLHPTVVCLVEPRPFMATKNTFMTNPTHCSLMEKGWVQDPLVSSPPFPVVLGLLAYRTRDSAPPARNGPVSIV